MAGGNVDTTTTSIVIRQKRWLWIIWAVVGFLNAALVISNVIADTTEEIGIGPPLSAVVFLLGAACLHRQRTTLTADGVTHRILRTRNLAWDDFTAIVIANRGAWTGTSLRRPRPRPRIVIDQLTLDVAGGDSRTFAEEMGARHDIPVRYATSQDRNRQALIAGAAILLGGVTGILAVVLLT